MGGCCCQGQPQKTVHWQVADETLKDDKFQENLTNREWQPKRIFKKPRFARPVATFGVRICDDEHDCNISGAAFLPNGDIFLVDQANKKMKLFNKKTYQFKMSSQVPSLPQDVCAMPNGSTVYVTFPNSSKIRNIGVFFNDMQKTDTIQTVSKCTAIDSNKFGGLAVAVNIVGNQWQIHLMNTKGKIQKRIHGESLFLNPEHIVVTDELNLVVSDRGNNTVFNITPEGYVIFAYKEVKSPLGVFIDKKGYIYIAGPERIHQLNERGERVQYLLSKVEIGFSPLTLAYRPKDELVLVAGKSDKVKVYALT